MKSFFKTFFASFLGSAMLLVVLIIILFSSIISSIASSEQTVKVKPKSILYMTLDYEIPERSNENDLGLVFNGSSFKTTDNAGMNDILNNIKAAAIDPNISGIFIELSSLGISAASANIEEIRKELIKFRESGKFVVSYSEAYSQSAYYLATASDEIYLFPDGMLDIHGIATQNMFYKHLLDKLDIEMQIIRPANNKFKSAVEPYFLDKMSDANREQNEVLLNSMWENIRNDISVARNIDVATINSLADDLTLAFNPEVALEKHFVDGLLYRDEIIAKLQQHVYGGEDKKLNLIKNMQYAKVRPELYEGDGKIGVVYASGQIVDGEGDDTTIGGESLSKAIREARNDKKVKAIVMRVNSPGGQVVASEVIRREVELAAKEKPFIVSMGNYAASGGYWISSSSDYIFADPTTLTGSIGVFATVPNLKGFMNKKLGLTFDEVKTNENSDYGSITKPMSPYQLKTMQKYVTETYDDFITLVSTERNLRKTFVDSIAQGRVWSGADAIELGLVDELGGMGEAIAYAAKQAGLESYSIKEFPKQEDIFESLFKTETQDYYVKTLKNKLGDKAQYFEAFEMINNIEGAQALMPLYLYN